MDFALASNFLMHPERFAQRFRDVLPRFHDIPANPRQISWIVQQFDIRFEANSSRFSPLVQALLQHFRVESQWILHLPATLNVSREVYPAFLRHFVTLS